ncbi:MAG: LPS export ABC transporter periplasmic protein LptC [Alphaproteobacteria bacterium]|nr:LPS export ABC transporter periplasmic protein LptC [Alphaproteobacteria bacterium]
MTMQEDDQDDLFAALNKPQEERKQTDEETETPAAFAHHYQRRRGAVRVGQRRNKFYTKFVRSMRVVLPLAALGLVSVLFVFSGDNKDLIKAPPPKEEIVKQASIGKNELLDPRFDTYDKEGRPYTITAVRAFQTMDNSDVIYLEKPVADSTMSDGAWIALESVSGVYNQLAQTLELEGKVKLYHDAGYSLLMEQLDIDLKQNIAVSNVDVAGQGPIGTLQAKGMTANGADNILIFNGPAVLTLYNMDNILE